MLEFSSPSLLSQMDNLAGFQVRHSLPPASHFTNRWLESQHYSLLNRSWKHS